MQRAIDVLGEGGGCRVGWNWCRVVRAVTVAEEPSHTGRIGSVSWNGRTVGGVKSSGRVDQ